MQYTVQFKDRLPAMGYKTYFVVEDSRPMANTVAAVQAVETDFYAITVNRNGTLRMQDKRLGRVKVKPNQVQGIRF